MLSLFTYCSTGFTRSSTQLFPAYCLKLSPTPCCFTWFHNTALSVRVEQTKVTVGVAALVRSLLNTTGERIVIPPALSLPDIAVSCRLFADQRRRDKSFITASLASVAFVNNQPEPTCRKRSGQLSSTVRPTVALLCSWGKGMSSSSH